MNESLIDPNSAPQPDPNKDYLAELTAPGGKYDRTRFKDNEELAKAIAKGKYDSDEYIKTIERSNDAIRQDYLKLKADYESRAKLEELIDQMSKTQAAPPISNTPPANDVPAPQIDTKQIEELVSRKLRESETSKKQSENFNLVKSKLTERYGENFQSTLTKQIQDLGLSKEFVDDLARNHPNVLFRTLGIDQPVQTQPFQAPVRSNQNFIPTGEKVRNHSFYEQLRKENPKLYHDPKTVVQMHNDALRMGKSFDDKGELGFEHF